MKELRTDVFQCPFCGYQAEQMSISREITQRDIETAAKNDISKAILIERVQKYGWDIERATTVPVRFHDFHGRWPDLAEGNKIPRKTYYARVKSGWSYERAATEPVDRSKTPKMYRKRGIPDGVQL
ncbi:hypothetical protein [Paenibacillus sp. 7516]|uniref:hypothetical protein n=1 Tax=Paenibacillus sp. 7516 TaxID=2022549 RepID=UPI001BB018AC|nr:hypothetical protein [Paenibacillus sp. 7516]